MRKEFANIAAYFVIIVSLMCVAAIFVSSTIAFVRWML